MDVQKRIAVEPCVVDEASIVYIPIYTESEYENELRSADSYLFETAVKFYNYIQMFRDELTEDHLTRSVVLAIEALDLEEDCGYEEMIADLFYLLYLLQDEVDRCETSEYAVDYSKQVSSITDELNYQKEAMSIVENIALDEFI